MISLKSARDAAALLTLGAVDLLTSAALVAAEVVAVAGAVVSERVAGWSGR